MYSMPGYFQNMPTVGKALVNPNPENEQELKAVGTTSMSPLSRLLMLVSQPKRS